MKRGRTAGATEERGSERERMPDYMVLLIPAYNEARTLRGIVERAHKFVRWIVVIDDGSEDGTLAALEGLPVTVLVNPRNLGKGYSLWRGFQYALERGAQTIVTMDADGQHTPEDIPRLLDEARRNPDSIIIGARLVDREKMPRIRLLANRFANFWIAWACGYPIPDSQSGLRIYPIRAANCLRGSPPRAARFAFESETLIKAATAGIESVPVAIAAMYTRDARKSHYRPVVDTMKIAGTVAASLFTRGLYLPGLVRSLRRPKSTLESDKYEAGRRPAS